MSDKAPRDHKYCSECNQPYSFINCRYTLLLKGTHNICLKCAPKVKKRLLQ